MNHGPLTAIVVPCYDEERRLNPDAFANFARTQPFPLKLVLVNDGSRDGTLGVLQGIRDAAPDRFLVLDLEKNSGKAEAVRRGVLAALASEPAPAHVGYWDADLATPLDAIVAMRNVLESRPWLEVVLGSRVRLLGRKIDRKPARHYLGRIFATAASLALGLPVYDTQCGAKLFRATPLTAELFRETFLSRWLFDVELLARLVQRRERFGAGPIEEIVYEFTLSRWSDVDGSKVKPTDFAKAAGELFQIWRTYRS